MRRAIAMLSAMAVAAVMTVGLSAQNTKFNGKWTVDQEKTTAANPAAAAGGGGGRGGAGGGGGGNRGGGGGGAFTLAVDASTLTRTPDAPAGGTAPAPTVYKLDGSEQTVTMRGGEAKVKAKWDDSKSKIVIEQTQDMGNGPTTSKIEYSMDGDWLVIATTAPPRGGGEAMTRKQYYKKA